MVIRLFLSLNKFPGMEDRFQQEVEDTMDRAVLAAIQAADPQTRVDTGALRANKEVIESSDERIIRWLQEYALYQDQGTIFHSGTNFTEAAAQAGSRVMAGDFNISRVVG
jgi:hypothetical protein